MPTVPVYNLPEAQPTQAPNVKLTDTSHMMMWQGIGARGLMAGGQQLMDSGVQMATTAAEQQATLNDATVKGGAAAWIPGATQLMYDPKNGYLNQSGQSAVANQQAAKDSLDKLTQSILPTLTNPRQVEMFNDAIRPMQQAYIQAIDKHASQELQSWSTSQSAAVAQGGYQQAIANATTNPDLYTHSMALGDAHIRDQYKDAPPEVADQQILTAHTQVHTAVINNLLGQNNPGAAQAAQAYYLQHKDDMDKAVTGNIENRITGTLEAENTKNSGLSLALSVKGQTSDIGAQEKILDQKFSAGQITADVYHSALDNLRADNNQRLQQMNEADRAFRGQIWDLKRQNPNATMANLTPQQLEYAKQRGMGDEVDSILSKSPATDNPAVYNDLMRQSTENPLEFSQMDLSRFSGQLSTAHYTSLEKAQQGINKQDAKAMESNRLVNNTIKSVASDMAVAGFAPTSRLKPGSQQAQDRANFEAALRDRLEIEKEKAGGVLTEDQARNVALGMLRTQTLTNTGMFGHFQTSEPVWKMTREQVAAPWQIPDSDRNKIAQGLVSRHLPATEEAIQAVYKKGYFVGKQ